MLNNFTASNFLSHFFTSPKIWPVIITQKASNRALAVAPLQEAIDTYIHTHTEPPSSSGPRTSATNACKCCCYCWYCCEASDAAFAFHFLYYIFFSFWSFALLFFLSRPSLMDSYPLVGWLIYLFSFHFSLVFYSFFWLFILYYLFIIFFCVFVIASAWLFVGVKTNRISYLFRRLYNSNMFVNRYVCMYIISLHLHMLLLLLFIPLPFISYISLC